MHYMRLMAQIKKTHVMRLYVTARNLLAIAGIRGKSFKKCRPLQADHIFIPFARYELAYVSPL